MELRPSDEIVARRGLNLIRDRMYSSNISFQKRPLYGIEQLPGG
jgi:hypothetical protein